ncbi:MAG: c-type cytochrome [Flavobacteriales bacterium]|nr:MAG: c-type cytochrome [Flavobacteriales bacterium]
MRNRTCVFVIATLIIGACNKDEEPSPANNGGGNAQIDVPTLPADHYDYSTPNLPANVLAYLANEPLLDNTPADNPITDAGATLGRVLYYDKKLSVNNVTACASCHHQDKAFTDGLAFSEGHLGGETRRNAMTTVNLRYYKGKHMFWDLRAEDLETQVVMPITDAIEMGMPSLSELETKLSGISYYPPLFEAAFGDEMITSDRVSKALAQFIRSITSFTSRYDQGLNTGFADFTPQELLGKTLVGTKFCTECHGDVTATGTQDQTFLIGEFFGKNEGFGSNNGLDPSYTDNGYGEISGLAQDQATFKFPSFRNVELTAPYMHDGRFATLEEVMDHYDIGITAHPNAGIQLPPGGIPLTPDEKSAIIAFLKTLTDHSLLTDVRYSDPFTQ